jgi:phosphatidylglycerol:prolipoprotein diacylglycerol transferase
MLGPYVHHIDPIIGTIGGLHLWWYGLSYSLGFLNAYVSIRRRPDLGLTRAQVLDLAILLSVGVLVGGRLVMVFHSREFFGAHPSLIPAVWLGGMATHGLLLGGFAGVALFCVIHRQPYRVIFDALAVPTAVILAAGRIGNFVDGQIVGTLTGVPWAVQFPDAEGFRHPVVLYDGLKNLLIIPLLLAARRRGAPAGREAALFLFLYAFLRIFVDQLREYPQTLLGLPAGQAFNVFFAIAGAALLVRSFLRGADPAAYQKPAPPPHADAPAGLWRRAAFAAIVLGSLVIPSDGIHDVPRDYGARHPGLEYSRLYIPLPQP